VIEWVLEYTRSTALQAVLVFVCALLVSVLLVMTFRFGLWAISWIPTYAGWPNNLNYTPRIQSTIEYMKAVPPYKREAIKFIEYVSWWVVMCVGLGEPFVYLPCGSNVTPIVPYQ